MTASGVHDMGGTEGHGRITVEPNEPVFHARWEGRVYGMMRRLLGARLFNLDQFRHTQERLPAAQYLASSYYQRWLAALELLVKETGASVTEHRPPETHAQATFAAGERVVTRNTAPLGHTRLPQYARGKRGVVESVRRPRKLPDTNADHKGSDWEPVYTVVFTARELWGPKADASGRVSIDLWQSYLEGDDER